MDEPKAFYNRHLTALVREAVRREFKVSAKDAERVVLPGYPAPRTVPRPVDWTPENAVWIYVEPLGTVKNQPEDPYGEYGTPAMRKKYQRVVDALLKDPWIAEAGAESYNSAWMYIWVTPRVIA
jgi:hypothetical protein